jgi:hypothetical protein
MSKNKTKEVSVEVPVEVSVEPVTPIQPITLIPYYEVLIRFNGIDHEGKLVCHEVGDKIKIDDMKRVMYYMNSRYVRKVLSSEAIVEASVGEV